MKAMRGVHDRHDHWVCTAIHGQTRINEQGNIFFDYQSTIDRGLKPAEICCAIQAHAAITVWTGFFSLSWLVLLRKAHWHVDVQDVWDLVCA
jgi:hypothetical protein